MPETTITIPYSAYSAALKMRPANGVIFDTHTSDDGHWSARCDGLIENISPKLDAADVKVKKLKQSMTIVYVAGACGEVSLNKTPQNCNWFSCQKSDCNGCDQCQTVVKMYHNRTECEEHQTSFQIVIWEDSRLFQDEFTENWLDNVWQSYKSKSFADFSLVTKTKTFRVHRHMLVAHSPVFKTMLSSDTKERRTGAVTMNYNAEAVEGLLKFLYHDRKSNLKDFALDVLPIAHIYKMQNIFGLCESLVCDNMTFDNISAIKSEAYRFGWEKLKKKANKMIPDYICTMYDASKSKQQLLDVMNEDNVVGVLASADLFKCEELKEEAFKMIASNLTAISATTQWKDLCKENRELVAEFAANFYKFVSDSCKTK